MEMTNTERQFLLDEIGDKRKLIDFYLRMIDEIKTERDNLQLQVEAMRKLVDAARAWKEGETFPYLKANGLAMAVDAYEEFRSGKRKNDFVPLELPVKDKYGFEHDMKVGPCSCGAVHKTEDAEKRKDGDSEAATCDAIRRIPGYLIECRLSVGHQGLHQGIYGSDKVEWSDPLNKWSCDCGCHGPLTMTTEYPCKGCGCGKA